MTKLLDKNQVANDFKGSLPKSEGLVLLSSLSTDRVRQRKLKYKKLATKSKKYGALQHLNRQLGQKKKNHKYHHRVGQKADRINKVINFCLIHEITLYSYFLLLGIH